MTDHVSGKSIIITGAGSGFGRLASEKLAARGALLLCVDIDGEAAEAVAEGIRSIGGRAEAMAANVALIGDMKAAAARAVAAFGAIDVIVNNAGIMPLAFLGDHAIAYEAWARCIDINFKGVLNGTVAVFDQMMAQGRGQVINISSIYGNAPVAGSAIYGATKAAVDYFSHSLRQEARGHIKVTVVKPSGVPNTGLVKSVVNVQAAAGIAGANVNEFFQMVGRTRAGDVDPAWNDPENIAHNALQPEPIADAIVHAIDQPWGVSISDITVRASGDHYIL